MKKPAASQITTTFAILCLCYMIPSYAQFQISPLGGQIIRQYDLELSQLSLLFSAPMIPAIFLSLAGGLLLDRFGPKRVIGVGLIVTAIGCVWRVFCASYAPLFTATMLTGLSACFINAGGGKILGGLFPAKDVSSRMGILMAASTAAMTMANFTSAWFPSIRSAFAMSAVFAVSGTGLWFLLVKNPEKQTADSADVGPDMRTCLKIAVKNGNVWLIAFALFFLMAANVVVGSFLPMALASRGVNPAVSGAMAACYTIGNLLGCILAPLSIRKLKSRKKVLILFSILAGTGVAFAWLNFEILLLAAALMLTGIFLGGMIPALMALPVQLPEIGPIYAGTAGGVIGTVQLLGAVLVPSYVLAPIAGGSFHMIFLLGGGCVLLAGGFSGCIRIID